MICPKCGNKPLSFATLLVTLNPFRVTCVSCGAALRARPVVYWWTAAHILLGVGLVWLYHSMIMRGVIISLVGAVMFIIGIAGLVFVTAYVIPWMFMPGAYRVAD